MRDAEFDANFVALIDVHPLTKSCSSGKLGYRFSNEIRRNHICILQLSFPSRVTAKAAISLRYTKFYRSGKIASIFVVFPSRASQRTRGAEFRTRFRSRKLRGRGSRERVASGRRRLESFGHSGPVADFHRFRAKERGFRQRFLHQRISGRKERMR